MSDGTRAAPSSPFPGPSLGKEEEEAVLAVLRSGWLTTGEVAARFEAEFAAFVGARHALALNSATAGLHLALEALGVGPGSVVLTTPYTFAATAEVVRYLGADPVFVDIDRTTLNIDPSLLEAALERLAEGGRHGVRHHSRARGGPALRHGRHRPPVAASTACRSSRMPRTPSPCAAGERFVGTLGDAGVYSFYATKTDHDRRRRDGGDRPRRARRSASASCACTASTGRSGTATRSRARRGSTTSSRPGYKYNLTDIAAAIGRVQLRKADAFLERRRAIARRYMAAFNGLDFLSLPAWAEDHAWHLFIIRVKPGKLSMDRDGFIEELQRRGIGVSVHFIPLHTMSYYRERYRLKPERFPRCAGMLPVRRQPAAFRVALRRGRGAGHCGRGGNRRCLPGIGPRGSAPHLPARARASFSTSSQLRDRIQDLEIDGHVVRCLAFDHRQRPLLAEHARGPWARQCPAPGPGRRSPCAASSTRARCGKLLAGSIS